MKKFFKLFLLFFIFLFISLFIINNSKFNFSEKGEYLDFVITNKPTLYVFYNESNINKETTLVNILSQIGEEYGEKISVDFISQNDTKIELFKEIFKIDLYPTLVLINENGFMSFNYQGSLNNDIIFNNIKLVVES